MASRSVSEPSEAHRLNHIPFSLVQLGARYGLRCVIESWSLNVHRRVEIRNPVLEAGC